MRIEIKFLILFFCIISAHSCNSKEINYTEVTSMQKDLKVKAEKLKKYYLKSTSGKEKIKYQKLFFDEFPNTFKELNDLYGFNNDTPAILYDYYYNHIIGLFAKLNIIDDKMYYQKLISIAIGGKWDADGIGAFQQVLNEYALKNPILIFNILENKNDEEIRSFWYFFFDGPHPDKNIPKELIKMKVINPKIYALMEEARSDVLKNVDN